MDLELWIDTWRGPLVGLFAARGVPWAEAPGMAEEVFAQAWLSRARFRGAAEDARAVGPWLAGIARNVQRVRARERARHGERQPIAPDEVAARPEGEPLEAAERRRLLRAAIDELPPSLREAVYAHHLEQSSQREVAALLGISERAVEGRLYRARVALRKKLDALEVQL